MIFTLDLKQNKSFKEIEKPHRTLKEHFEAREDVTRDFITPSLYYKSGLMDSAPWIATLADLLSHFLLRRIKSEIYIYEKT